MDWMTGKETVVQTIKKYRYVAVVILAGILLMAVPQESGREATMVEKETGSEESLEAALSRILSRVAGAGNVEVLLAEKSGEQILYQTDEDQSQTDTARDLRRQTVLVEDSSRQKTGLVRQINPPVYQGAVVLAQGADNAAVRLSLVEAVMGATGLPSHCITVLKMK